MLIKYITNQSFENNTLTINELLDQIKIYLENKNADNIVIDRNIISFNNTIWKFASNIAYMTYIKKGIIEIETSDKRIDVKFTSYVSILTDILLIIIILLIGIVQQKILLVFSVLLFIQLVFRLTNTKSRSTSFIVEMFNKITTT